ncbi:MAG: hypothetical protein R3D83_02150 [Caenibius sp.]
MRAAADNISPGDVLPPSNMVADAEEAAAKDAGRIVEARPVSERGELTRQTVTNYMGQPVPKVGPIDMVWLAAPQWWHGRSGRRTVAHGAGQRFAQRHGLRGAGAALWPARE